MSNVPIQIQNVNWASSLAVQKSKASGSHLDPLAAGQGGGQDRMLAADALMTMSGDLPGEACQGLGRQFRGFVAFDGAAEGLRPDLPGRFT